ncbi:MAG: trypsin-like peptidase domain-containing protein [Clostridia bacterium]|nr:trypsin-like peptidase domain-containing protein [Clostridia bacterium]
METTAQTTAIPSSLGSQIASATVSGSSVKVDYVAVAEKAKPTVVEITTEIVSNNSYFQQYVESGAGSGVIISTDGYIITNNHVIDGASKITVRLTTGDEHEAVLIGTDSQSDIAVLKIEATGLPYATLGDSTKLAVGEEVLAIGNPLGSLGGSVTNGIISALDREITIDGQKMQLLQTNAAINPGNSGGGLFNMNGELIAIVNAKSYGDAIEGLGFAIPINYAHEVAQELLKNGYVSGRPAIGISYIVIDDYMDLMRFRVSAYGVYVYDGGETSLENGDRIVRFGDYEVQNAENLKSAIQTYKVGDTVNVTVVRNGQYTDLSVTLVEDKPVETKIELKTETN